MILYIAQRKHLTAHNLKKYLSLTAIENNYVKVTSIFLAVVFSLNSVSGILPAAYLRSHWSALRSICC